MKKNIWFLSAVLLFQVNVCAQESETPMTKKWFSALSGGVALPVGSFSSSSYDDADAGYANTGFFVNLGFGYSFDQRYGLASNLFFTQYSVKNEPMFPDLKGDHWQYYGLTVGPMFTLPFSGKSFFDMKFLVGAVRANSPTFKSGSESTNDPWATAFAFQGGIDYRYQFGEKAFLMINVDYTGLKPDFTYTISGTDETLDISQKMDALHIGVGIGLKF